jgi:hypothetical protein
MSSDCAHAALLSVTGFKVIVSANNAEVTLYYAKIGGLCGVAKSSQHVGLAALAARRGILEAPDDDPGR